MNRRLAFGFFLAAALAYPANWSFNPFKRSKDASKTDAPKPIDATKDKSKSAHEFDSQYMGGTVAHIPQFTNGTLDLSDARQLRFHYGKPTWSVDYAQITRIEVGDRKAAPKFVKIPKLMTDKRVFTLTFKGDKGAMNSLVLEVPVNSAFSALPLLEERTGKSAVVEGAQDPDHQWTDRYWRTSTNKGVWEEATGKTKTAVAVK
ncbi:MAG: hypothetical protein HY820_17150 [Acidobacteria bacterium]|nr:hypothetical protein [Acidobacteriota bacterium]